ncbi:MAG TPA: hypothetical protein PKV16_04745 [Caldisericia bacterium]|mgnify:CR=1 FL=1|nr:hypothetical protein [Caldisericia bacterium]HPF48619.1 hypothetical protein [Caldisericia bacterium]HPI83721.1 hypothetical protein [Caldisericia bacterium]HPQ93074.1 hypothetical protein [Caldisericia bacterium]
MFCGIKQILLGLEDVTEIVARVMITDTLKQPVSADVTFKTIAPDIEIDDTPYQELRIYDNHDRLVFGGRVEGVPTATDTEGGLIYCIKARDWTVECDYRQVREHFVGWSISDIYKALVQKYLPGHTTSGVNTCEDIITIQFNGITAAECFDTLSELAGWSWKIDSNKDHYFGKIFIEKVQSEITDSVCDFTKGKTTRFEKDFSTLANRVWVEGGDAPAKNTTEQWITLDELNLTENETISEKYPNQIPIWYETDSVSVYAIFDGGTGELARGKLVPLDCGTNESVAGVQTYTPTSDESWQKPGKYSVTGYQWGNFSAPEQTTHRIIAEFDAIHIKEASSGAAGGFVYLSSDVSERIESDKVETDTGFIADRIKEQLDPTPLNADDAKLLGFLVKYKRNIKISFVSEIDSESVANYGVQIDLPKVSKGAIKDWGVLYKYADFLLQSHKDPPKKGKVTVWRYKNGVECYPKNMESGQLVDINLTRFGAHPNVKLTKVIQEITPDSWRTTAESTLDPNLYSTLFSDMLKRIRQLEVNEASQEIIDSLKMEYSTLSLSRQAPLISDVNPTSDYGFGVSLFGASEWE